MSARRLAKMTNAAVAPPITSAAQLARQEERAGKDHRQRQISATPASIKAGEEEQTVDREKERHSMAEVRGGEVDVEAGERAENERQQAGRPVIEQLAETIDAPERQRPQQRLDNPGRASEHPQGEHRRGSSARTARTSAQPLRS